MVKQMTVVGEQPSDNTRCICAYRSDVTERVSVTDGSIIAPINNLLIGIYDAYATVIR